MVANVVCPSFDTYAFEPVEKYEAVRDPGLTAAAAMTAWAIPRC